jgi:hypothetical protein
MMGELTPRQREILAALIATANERKAAQVLDIAFSTLQGQKKRIIQALNLPCAFITFGEVAIGHRFKVGSMTYRRVPHATDRYGGYNAEDIAGGNRRLFHYPDIVEKAGE